MQVRRTIRGLLAQATLAAATMVLPSGVSHAVWTQTSGPRGGTVGALVAVPSGSGATSLYAGQIRAWRTDDNGASWTHLSSGLTDPNAFDLLAVPNGSGGSDIFLGSNSGVFRSS